LTDWAENTSGRQAIGRAGAADRALQHVVRQADEEQMPEQRHGHERQRGRAGEREAGRDEHRVERRLVAGPPQEPRPLAAQDVHRLKSHDRGIGVHAAGVDQRGQPRDDRGHEQGQQRHAAPPRGRAGGLAGRRGGWLDHLGRGHQAHPIDRAVGLSRAASPHAISQLISWWAGTGSSPANGAGPRLVVL
jgi:hypothetical protein